MIFLVEIDCLDEEDRPRTLRFSDCGLMTRPQDDPPNTYYAPRVVDPGNIERHLFSDGRTFGDLSVGVGDVLLSDIDGGLGHLRGYAFDGRAIRIWSMADRRAPFSSRRLCLEGTMAETEYQGGNFAVTVLDWLEALRTPLQTVLYKGTTTAPNSAKAEGGEDLKDKTKTLVYGNRRGIPLVLVDPHHEIYEYGSNGASAVTVLRDGGVPLPGRGDHSTLAALRAAALVPGEYATCLRLGLARLGGTPFGLVTADVLEGAQPSDRTAAQIARRMLVRAGMVAGEDYLDSDVAALDAVAPAECNYWLGPDNEESVLGAVAFVLSSVGATITPDFTGVYRMRRLVAPVATTATRVVEESYVIGPGDDLDRDASSDQSDGLPVKKIVVRYAQNSAVVQLKDVDAANTTAEYRSFASEEWRQVAEESAATAARHLRSHEVTFDTALCHEADARREAARRLDLYRVVREVYRLVIKVEYAADIDLADVVLFRAANYGLVAGRPYVVIGILDEYEPEHRTLTLWG